MGEVLLEEIGLRPSDFQTYSGPFGETPPSLVSDRHPDGEFLAMKAPTWAAVWSLKSKRIFWRPPSTFAICWAASGTEVLSLRINPNVVGDEFGRKGWEKWTSLERRSWPDLQLLNGFPVGTEEYASIIASPVGSLVAITEGSQNGFYLILVDYTSTDPSVKPKYENAEMPFTRGPVFSPDGRYLVTIFTDLDWVTKFGSWSDGEDQDTDERKIKVGRVLILSTLSDEKREEFLIDELPELWSPPLRDESVMDLIDLPEFQSERAFTVRLPSGLVRHLTI